MVENNNEEQGKGFAGPSAFVSDAETVPHPAAQNEPAGAANPASGAEPASQTAQPQLSQEPSELSSGSSISKSGIDFSMSWMLGTAAAAVLCLFGVLHLLFTNPAYESSSSSVLAHAPSNDVPAHTPYSPPTPMPSSQLPSSPEEVTPPLEKNQSALDASTRQAPPALPRDIPTQLMANTYGEYHSKYSCWKTTDKDGQDYCMRITRIDKIRAGKEGERIYVLATGQILNDNGALGGSHADSGLVGAFVVKNNSHRYKIIASNPQISMGTWGEAPTEWKFVQLGPSDYWGWQSEECFMFQGIGTCYAVLLSPYGKSIKNIGGIASLNDNSGFWEEDKSITSLKTILRIGHNIKNVKIYPLFITVTGKDREKIFSEKTWKIPFNDKKWEYVAPKNYPLDADF